MRSVVLAMAIAMMAPALPAQEAGNPGIEATINRQMEAFRAQDVGTAFGFASPAIKRLFGSAENFGQMVRQGYPMVWDPGTVRMLELREVGGALWQRVMVTDRAGATHVLDYRMIETPEGWQIDGVQILPRAGVGA